jgi:predicted ATPase
MVYYVKEESMIKTISWNKTHQKDYPFVVSSLKEAGQLVFSSPVTIFVGDNGSGKSTLLTAIAKAHGAINTLYHPLSHPYYDHITPLSNHVTLTYDIQSSKGFLFSGEHFITFIHRQQDEASDLKQYMEEVDIAYQGKPEYSKMLALGPARKELHAIKHTYDGELSKKSHGEGFISFFKARMHQKGIYFLDEPESPLSPQHQYQLLVLLTDLVKNGSQIIMATHSPILMALEHATIYEFQETIQQVDYEDIESVKFMKYFLNHRHVFLERLKNE